MSETSEKDELNGLIDRSRAGIEQHLIEMGVKDDVAARAVGEQVEFGRGPGGALLMKRGKWIASPISYQRECAQHILSSLAPEDMKNIRDDENDGVTYGRPRNAACLRPIAVSPRTDWTSFLHNCVGFDIGVVARFKAGRIPSIASNTPHHRLPMRRRDGTVDAKLALCIRALNSRLCRPATPYVKAAAVPFPIVIYEGPAGGK